LRGAATDSVVRPRPLDHVPHRPYEGQQLNGNSSYQRPSSCSSSPLRGAATCCCTWLRLAPGRFLIAPTRGSNAPSGRPPPPTSSFLIAPTRGSNAMLLK